MKFGLRPSEIKRSAFCEIFGRSPKVKETQIARIIDVYIVGFGIARPSFHVTTREAYIIFEKEIYHIRAKSENT
ncbi:MAG: hypothetical protein J6V01_06590, partial [Clostridia bacterium]|nr:hypothetical protein [Clostridia bacterium]